MRGYTRPHTCSHSATPCSFFPETTQVNVSRTNTDSCCDVWNDGCRVVQVQDETARTWTICPYANQNSGNITSAWSTDFNCCREGSLFLSCSWRSKLWKKSTSTADCEVGNGNESYHHHHHHHHHYHQIFAMWPKPLKLLQIPLYILY